MNRILFKNAFIPQPIGILKKFDVLVENGKIKDISHKIEIADANIVDIKNKILFPAFIDLHCHFKLRINKKITSRDDFETGTRAQAAGGVGIVGDFTDGNDPNPKKDLKIRLNDIKESYCNYILHCVIKNVKEIDEFKKRLRLLSEAGFRSVKIFTAYGSRGMRLNDNFFPYLLDFASKNNIVICVHAEDDDIINYNLSYFNKSKKIPIRYHNVIRNEFSENYAILKLLKLNELFNAKLYFVHISSFKSLELIANYRSKGYDVYAETCPQYLVFDNSVYNRDDNYLFTFTPPVRDRLNKNLIIENLKYFDTIATDSCGFNKTDKLIYINDLLKIPMGISTSQLTSSIIYTFGVKTKKINFYHMQKLLSSNAARIFLFKNKGEIKKGYDADICIFDPDITFEVNNKELLHASDYSCYEGIKLSGKVTALYLDGKKVYSDGIFSKPFGSYLNTK